MRKAIARVLTVLSEKRRDAARAMHKDAKHTPRDLRYKKTRAFRRRLTPAEAKKKKLPSVRSNNNNLVPIVLSPVVVNMMQGPVVNTSHLTRNVTIRGATRAAVLSKAKPIETVLINLERQSWAQLTRLSRGNAQVAQVSEIDEE